MVAPENNSKFGFTKANLEKLPTPTQGKRLYFYDKGVNGLGVSVTSAGTKSFFVYRKIEGKPVRVTLGRFPDMSIEAARKKGMAALSQIAEGINPIDEKRRDIAESVTLSEVLEAYLKVRKTLKASTVQDYHRAMKETFFDWLDRPMKSITKDMAARRHAKRGEISKARANNAFRVLRALFNFAYYHYEDSKGNSVFPENPVDRLSATKGWFKTKRKQSYITRTDLPRWFAAVMALESKVRASKVNVVRDYLLFLLFTGVRREEAASLKWSDVDLDEVTFTLQETKNSETITLPMSDFLLNIMKQRFANKGEHEYVFPGEGETGHLVEPRKQIMKIREVSGVDFSPHDLRRTFATIAESLDISRYTIKRLLNHKINHDSDVTAGYVVASIDRLKAATEKVAGHILFLVKFPHSKSETHG